MLVWGARLDLIGRICPIPVSADLTFADGSPAVGCLAQGPINVDVVFRAEREIASHPRAFVRVRHLNAGHEANGQRLVVRHEEVASSDKSDHSDHQCAQSHDDQTRHQTPVALAKAHIGKVEEATRAKGKRGSEYFRTQVGQE